MILIDAVPIAVGIKSRRSRTWATLLRLCNALLLLLTLSHCAQFSAATADLASTDEPQQQQPEQQQSKPRQAAEPAISTDATTSVAHARLTLTPELQSQFQQAKQLMRAEEYQAALMLLEPLALAVPEAAGIGYNLALCYWQLQQTALARQQLTTLLESQPEYVDAVNLLGVIARQAGNFNQARRYWLDALAQQSDFASVHKNLGFLYELYLAQPEQARYHYRQYQRLTGDPMAEAWLSLLDQQQE